LLFGLGRPFGHFDYVWLPLQQDIEKKAVQYPSLKPQAPSLEQPWSTERTTQSYYLIFVFQILLLLLITIISPQSAFADEYQLWTTKSTKVQIVNESVAYTFTDTAQWHIKKTYSLRNPTESPLELRIGMMRKDSCSYEQKSSFSSWNSKVIMKARGAELQCLVDEAADRTPRQSFYPGNIVRYYDIRFAPREIVDVYLEYTSEIQVSLLGELFVPYSLKQPAYWNGPVAQWEFTITLPNRPASLFYAFSKNVKMTYYRKIMPIDRTATIIKLSANNLHPDDDPYIKLGFYQDESPFEQGEFVDGVIDSIDSEVLEQGFEGAICAFERSLFGIIEPFEGAFSKISRPHLAKISLLIKQDDIDREIRRTAKRDAHCPPNDRELLPSRCSDDDAYQGDLREYTDQRLQVCRNLPFAVHGRLFKSPELNEIYYGSVEYRSMKRDGLQVANCDESGDCSGEIRLTVNPGYSHQLLRPIDHAYIKAIDREINRRKRRR
jgi:hypothetical protein